MKINTRMERDEYFIKMARLASLRGACVRRQTGCILVNSLNHVIATGYNGRARGVANCFETPCEGAGAASGDNLEGCEAIHAEANALLQCKDVEEITTAYCTTAPCIHCVKLLMNTGCTRIVFQDPYPHMERSENLWMASLFHREWEMLPKQHEIFEGPIEPACHHSAWVNSQYPTNNDSTKYKKCVECGLLKEVCK